MSLKGIRDQLEVWNFDGLSLKGVFLQRFFIF